MLIRRWQVAFCQGNNCAAALLNFYEYWHTIKLDMRAKNVRLNDIAEMHGDKRAQDESLLQFHTLEELAEGINHLYSKNTITAANRLLESLGAISISNNPNPKYKFDKTHYIIFYPEICNTWLTHYYDLQSNCLQKKPTVNEEIKQREDAIPLIPDKNVALDDRDTKLNDRSPNFALSTPKIALLSPKTVTLSPKIGKAITEITTITTNKEEAAESELSKNCLSENTTAPPVVAPAVFLSKNENTILDTLTKAQIAVIDQQIDAKWQALSSTPNLQAFGKEKFSLAIKADMVDANVFKKAHPNFLFKLNTMLSEAKRGRWQLRSTLPVKTTPYDKKQQKTPEQIIKNTLNQLILEKNGLRANIAHLKSIDPVPDVLIHAFEIELNDYDRQIQALLVELDASPPDKLHAAE